MEFRLAKEEDIDTVYDYIRKLAVFESREDDFKLDKETLYRAMFVDDLGEVMLATEDGKIIGYCFFYHVFSSFSGLTKMYLEDMYIDEQYRGGGRGREFFRQMAKTALSRGYGSMIWGALDWNVSAIGLYLKIGAEVENGRSHFELPLDKMGKLISE